MSVFSAFPDRRCNSIIAGSARCGPLHDEESDVTSEINLQALYASLENGLSNGNVRTRRSSRGNVTMKAFLLAVMVVVGIGFASSVVLETYQRTAQATFVGSGVRP